MRRLPIVLPLVLAACTVGPDYQRPATPGELGEWIARTDSTPVDQAPWTLLNDQILSSLIDDALAANLDVKEIDARLREARALRDFAAGRALPELNATGSAQQQQVSKNGQLPAGNIPGFDRNYSLFDLGFDASWEIDLWGANRRSVEAAGGQVEAADAGARDMRLQVVAEVARTYAELRGAQASLASARENAEAQAGIARLVRQRYESGEAARFDETRAESQARATAAAIPGFEADIRTATYDLATLTGRPPEALLKLLDAVRPVPSPPVDVALGLRSDMLRRRPDVRAAEADLAAATANIGVTTADLFPRFSLTGSFGQQAREPGDLASSDSTRFQIGPSFRWPIFDAGRVRANIGAADARADQAAARYTKAVLSALADSETAINRYAAAQATARDREAAAAASAISLDLARQRYRAGEDDLLTLLDVQSAYTNADRTAVQARQQALIDYVAVVKALGGGVVR